MCPIVPKVAKNAVATIFYVKSAMFQTNPKSYQILTRKIAVNVFQK